VVAVVGLEPGGYQEEEEEKGREGGAEGIGRGQEERGLGGVVPMQA